MGCKSYHVRVILLFSNITSEEVSRVNKPDYHDGFEEQTGEAQFR